MSIATISAAQLRAAADIKDKIAGLTQELKNILGITDQPEERYQHKLRPLPKRRFMSAEARAKIAAAARRRWRRAKAAGRNSL